MLSFALFTAYPDVDMGISAKTATERLRAMNHQFWCQRHGEYAIESDAHCTVMAARCPTCIEKDREYNDKNTGADRRPAAFSPVWRCNCQRTNKRTSTTGMWA